MQAGKLRHRIKLYRPTASRSATGAVKQVVWEHILTLWGRFTPLSVKDIITGQAHDTQVTARCMIRHRTDINGTMRVEHMGKMYEIVGEPLADKDSGREYLTLMLRGVSND